MKTSTLQAMLATNAAIITREGDYLAVMLLSAKFLTFVGKKSYAAEQYKDASKQRNKLAKVVKLQHEMKQELAHIRRVARIEAKSVRLWGINPAAAPLLTSVEIESSLDDLLAERFPKKADSRVKVA